METRAFVIFVSLCYIARSWWERSMTRNVLGDNIGGESFASIIDQRLLPIDAVYTWVNGSDPEFSKSMMSALKKILSPRMKERRSNSADNLGKYEGTLHLYADNDQLKYSIRSLVKYAPWIRKIYIVTSGQTPVWLDTLHPKIVMVRHREIFQDQSFLPTFNSNAIELSLHRIPGLSDNFLYFNDDFYLGRKVWPEDFHTIEGGTGIYLGRSFPTDLSSPAQGLKQPSTNEHSYRTNDYVQSLNMVRQLLDEKFNFKVLRQIMHVPYFIKRRVLSDLWRTLPTQLSSTASQKLRSGSDLQFPTLYFSFLMAQYQQRCSSRHGKARDCPYAYTVRSTNEVYYGRITNLDTEAYAMFQELRRTVYKFICINDGLDYTKDNHETATRMLRDFHQEWLPDRSPYELNSEQP